MEFQAAQIFGPTLNIEARSACRKEAGLSPDETKIDFKTAKQTAVVPMKNPALASFYECYWKRTGFQNRDGTINTNLLLQQTVNVLKLFVGEERARMLTPKFFGDCHMVREITHGLTVIGFLNCLYARVLDLRPEEKFVPLLSY